MRQVTLWGLTIVVAGMFLLAGALKLAGVEMEVQLFATIGFGQWFRYLTGLLEIAGAIGLFVPSLAPYAALLLASVMVGALVTHVVIGGNPIAAILLFVAALTLAWLRRLQISSRGAVVA